MADLAHGKSNICLAFTGGMAALLWPGSFPLPTCPKRGDHPCPHHQQSWRDVLGMQGRDVCAVRGIDLSALGRVWGYLLTATWDIPLSFGLWVFLLGCKQKSQYYHLSSSFRDREGFIVSEHWAYSRWVQQISLSCIIPQSHVFVFFFFLYLCRISGGTRASSLKFSISATLRKNRSI